MVVDQNPVPFVNIQKMTSCSSSLGSELPFCGLVNLTYSQINNCPMFDGEYLLMVEVWLVKVVTHPHILHYLL